MKRAAIALALAVTAVILLLYLRASIRADQAAAASASAAWSSLLGSDDRTLLPTEDEVPKDATSDAVTLP